MFIKLEHDDVLLQLHEYAKGQNIIMKLTR